MKKCLKCLIYCGHLVNIVACFSKKTVDSTSRHTDCIFCELHSNSDKVEPLHVQLLIIKESEAVGVITLFKNLIREIKNIKPQKYIYFKNHSQRSYVSRKEFYFQTSLAFQYYLTWSYFLVIKCLQQCACGICHTDLRIYFGHYYLSLFAYSELSHNQG